VVRKTRTERAAAKARWVAGKMNGRRTWGEEMRGVEMIEGLVVEAAAATETSVGRRRTGAAAAEMIGERIEEEEEGATINKSPVIVVAGRTGRGGWRASEGGTRRGAESGGERTGRTRSGERMRTKTEVATGRRTAGEAAGPKEVVDVAAAAGETAASARTEPRAAAEDDLSEGGAAATGATRRRRRVVAVDSAVKTTAGRQGGTRDVWEKEKERRRVEGEEIPSTDARHGIIGETRARAETAAVAAAEGIVASAAATTPIGR
jgi:hypothetical protein